MAQWRIRAVVPDGPDGQHALRTALAQVQVTELRLAPLGPAVAELKCDVVVELGDEGSLGDLLRGLHELSPQVFISRVSQPEPTTAADAARRQVRARKLRRALKVPG